MSMNFAKINSCKMEICFIFQVPRAIWHGLNCSQEFEIAQHRCSLFGEILLGQTTAFIVFRRNCIQRPYADQGEYSGGSSSTCLASSKQSPLSPCNSISSVSACCRAAGSSVSACNDRSPDVTGRLPGTARARCRFPVRPIPRLGFCCSWRTC
jgi:hypothetical protein